MTEKTESIVSRRDFLKVIGATAAGLLHGGVAPAVRHGHEVEILRAFKDNGIEVTVAELDVIAENHRLMSEGGISVPVTPLTPKGSRPIGWVRRLVRRGDSLFADLDPELPSGLKAVAEVSLDSWTSPDGIVYGKGGWVLLCLVPCDASERLLWE